MKKGFLSILIVLLTNFTWGQVKFSKTPLSFYDDFKNYAAKTATDTQKTFLDNFQPTWLSEKITPLQKKNTMKAIQTMADNKHPFLNLAYPMQLLSSTLDKGGNQAQLDTLSMFFEYCGKELNIKQTSKVFKTLDLYINQNILFKDPVTTVFIENGKLDFSLLSGSTYTFKEDHDLWGGNEGFEEFNTFENEAQEETFFEEDLAAIKIFTEPMPSLDGPLIRFKGVNIKIITAKDSVVVQNTSGSLALSSGEFVGKGGKFDWSMAGKPEIFVEFKDFHFLTNKPEIKAEDVELTHTERVDGKIRGIFDYKHVPRKDSTAPKYPRFLSYYNDINLKGLSEEIEYSGGIGLMGAQLISGCVGDHLSTVSIKNDEKTQIKVMAPSFQLEDSLIYAKPAKAIIYFAQNDSITHPGVQFKYKASTKTFLMRKDNTPYKDSPFSNSYHLVEMNVDQIDGIIGDSIIKMRIVDARMEIPAFFESDQKFTETDYARLKGYFSFHPLQVIVNYMTKKRVSEFSIIDLADYTQQKDITIRKSIESLQMKGLVKKNPVLSTYSLTDKGKHLYNSRTKKEDYDIISIQSLAVTRPVDPSVEPIMSLPDNAILKLDSNDLEIYGVDEVIVSDSNNVHFYPKDRKMVIQKGRKIILDGKVTTDTYIFSGTDFEFDYDEFTFNLEHVDSIQFMVEVIDSVTGKKKKEIIENKLNYSQGKLFIDAPSNKSGLKSEARYPHFDADHGAAVLFDKEEILGSAYDTTFRYLIPPFSVDSMGSGSEATLTFDGEFQSGGVFPIIKEKLSVLGDKGFGFSHVVPDKGYPVFGGKGMFYGKISMGNRGLRGEGKLVFLNTTLESKDFVFYKDSVAALGELATTKEGTNPTLSSNITFPNSVVNDYEMKWYVSKDSMILTNYENAFKLYDDKAELSGKLIISTKGMMATGLLETNGSLTISKKFTLKENSFDSKQGQFEILSNVVGKPAVRSDYVDVSLDFDKNMAVFHPSEQGKATNDFPFLKYQTTLNDGYWDIAKRKVVMEKPDKMDISQSKFISTKTSQDSLAFNAKKATYFIDSLQLNIEGVPFINIADARVQPKGGELQIRENAKINTLQNAIIVMDTTHEFHTLVNGELDINSRTDLDGHASYQFVNFEQDTIILKFSDFKLQAIKSKEGLIEYHTVARGSILESDSFLVAPQMQFKGEVSMFAHRRLLSLDGFIKLDLHGAVDTEQWLRYNNKDDSDIIKVDLELDENKQNLDIANGLHFNMANMDYYVTFLKPKADESDQSVLTASGYLIRDLETNEFEVIDKARFNKQSYGGSIFGYIEDEERYDFDGKILLLNQKPNKPLNFNFEFGGTGDYHILDSSLVLDGLARIRLDLPQPLNETIVKKFALVSKFLHNQSFLTPSDSLYNRIGSIIGPKEVAKLIEKTKGQEISLSKNTDLFSEGFCFNHLKLKWNAEQKAWHSVGPLALVSMGLNDLNFYVKGYIELKKTEDEDQLNVYLELTPNVYYMFQYLDNSLRINSGDEPTTTYVTTKNTELKNISKGKYYFGVLDEEELLRFKKHFVTNYLNGDDVVVNYGNLPLDLINDEKEYEEDFTSESPKTDPVDPFDEEKPKVDDNNKKEPSDAFEEDLVEKPTEDEKKKDKEKKSSKNKDKEKEVEIKGDEEPEEF